MLKGGAASNSDGAMAGTPNNGTGNNQRNQSELISLLHKVLASYRNNKGVLVDILVKLPPRTLVSL